GTGPVEGDGGKGHGGDVTFLVGVRRRVSERARSAFAYWSTPPRTLDDEDDDHRRDHHQQYDPDDPAVSAMVKTRGQERGGRRQRTRHEGAPLLSETSPVAAPRYSTLLSVSSMNAS